MYPTPDMLAGLIPESFFAARAEWPLWLMAAFGIAVLVFGADRAVGAGAKLAAALGMSKVIIGATVVSLGTTSPEAVVSVRAAWMGDPGLALGNGVGSIIADTALIFGLCCLLRRLPLDSFVLNRHGWLQLGSGVLLVGLSLVLLAVAGDINNVFIPRWAGVGLLVLLVVYLYLSVKWARRHPEILEGLDVEVEAPAKSTVGTSIYQLLMVLFGLALVIGGAEMLIGSVQEISIRRGVPSAVLAVTLVAFGTSLPELATALAAILKGHGDMMVGNIVGADILNVLFVVGASATATRLQVQPYFFYLFFPVMMFVLILLRIFIFTSGSSFRRWQGVPLLGAYVVFIWLTLHFGVAASV
ncbi:MAG: calcium/sodium antiporter [Planctomycetota bacterium]